MPTFCLDCPLEAWIERSGRILARLEPRPGQGLRSLVAEMDARRAFFKQARTASARARLARVVKLYETVRHPCLPPLWGYWAASDGPTLVHEWLPGHDLQDAQAFLSLASPQRARALTGLLELGVLLAGQGLVSRALDPSRLRWDLASTRLWLTGPETWEPGPLRNWRQPREAGWEAPEERRRGGRVDERSLVYRWGRLLQHCWGEDSACLERATRAQPAERFPRVSQLLSAWRCETGGPISC